MKTYSFECDDIGASGLSAIMRILIVCMALTSVKVMAAPAREVRTFEYLGGNTFRHKINYQGYPVPAKTRGYQVEGVGWNANDSDSGGVAITYFFELKVPRRTTIYHMLVEDVTDEQPVVLVDDNSPVITGRKWRGGTEPIQVSRTQLPWAYTKDDTWRIYRFKISTSKKKIEILQPFLIGRAYKAGLRITKKALFKAIQPKGDPRRGRLRASAMAMLEGGDSYLLIDLDKKPTEVTTKNSVNALKQARDVRVPLVIASENQEWADTLLMALLSKAWKGDLKKVRIVVVSPKPDATKWAPFAKRYRTTIDVGPLVD